MGAIGDSSALTTAQLTTVAEIMVAGAFFSTLGSLVIITVFLNSPELRKSFAFQLVFGLALAELGNSFWPYFFMPREGAACECQAVLLQFFSFASIAWSAVIAWTLEMATNTERKPGGPSPSSLASSVLGIGDPTRVPDVRKFHVAVWSTSFVLVLVPWAAGVYGPAGAWCWIDPRHGAEAHALRLVCFYLPLWCVVGFQIRTYRRVYSRLRRVASLAAATAAVRADMRREARERDAARISNAGHEKTQTGLETNAESSVPDATTPATPGGETAKDEDEVDVEATLRRLLRRLGAYPAVLIVAWTFPTINRLNNYVQGAKTGQGDDYTLYVLMALGMSTQGVGNAVVYGMSGAVRREAAVLLERWTGARFVLGGPFGRWGRGSAAGGLARLAREGERGTEMSARRAALPAVVNAEEGGDAGPGDEGREVLLEVDESLK